jgi:hypothetical protein
METRKIVENCMVQLLAHMTHNEIPSFWLAALVGFAAGVVVTHGMCARKMK